MNEESLKIWEQDNIDLLTSREMGEWLHRRDMNARPQGDIKKYKPLEPDYNVQCAVENLRVAYWSNEPEKVAKNFTEAEDIIISAICHHGYAVCKQPQGEWIYHDKLKKYYCKNCGLFEPFTKEEVEEGVKLPNFCEQCGADMRKGGTDHASN